MQRGGMENVQLPRSLAGFYSSSNSTKDESRSHHLVISSNYLSRSQALGITHTFSHVLSTLFHSTQSEKQAVLLTSRR